MLNLKIIVLIQAEQLSCECVFIVLICFNDIIPAYSYACQQGILLPLTLRTRLRLSPPDHPWPRAYTLFFITDAMLG